MTRQHVLKLEVATFKADFKSLTWITPICKLIWSKFSSDTHHTSQKKKLCCLYFFKAAIVWNIWNFSSSGMTSITNLLKIHTYSSYLQIASHNIYKDFPYSCYVFEMQWGYHFMCNCPRMPCFYKFYGEIIVTVWYVAFWAVEFKIISAS